VPVQRPDSLLGHQPALDEDYTESSLFHASVAGMAEMAVGILAYSREVRSFRPSLHSVGREKEEPLRVMLALHACDHYYSLLILISRHISNFRKCFAELSAHICY
jgi:hypothetical protein